MYAPLACGHLDFSNLRMLGSMNSELGVLDFAHLTLYQTPTGVASIQYCTDTHKGFDYHVIMMPEAVQLCVFFEYVDWLHAHFPGKVNEEISADAVFEWMTAAHDDPGFELLVSHFLTGATAEYKKLRLGIRLMLPEMICSALKALLDWNYGRNMTKVGPAVVQFFADQARFAGLSTSMS